MPLSLPSIFLINFSYFPKSDFNIFANKTLILPDHHFPFWVGPGNEEIKTEAWAYWK